MFVLFYINYLLSQKSALDLITLTKEEFDWLKEILKDENNLLKEALE